MKIQRTFQADIVKRAIGEKSFPEFVQQYNEARHQVRGLKEPSQNDLRIVSLLKKEKSVGRVSKLLHVSPYAVFGAISRVSAYK